MVANLLEQGDHAKRLRTSNPVDCLLGLLRVLELLVHFDLRGHELDKDDVLVFDGHYRSENTIRNAQRLDSAQQRTNSRYLVSSSAVLRIINLFAISSSSFSFCSEASLSLSVASASRPRKMGLSKFLRNSAVVPSAPGQVKLSKLKYSV